MAEAVRIVSVERDNDDGILVVFSDGTTCGYVVEELLELRPFREKVKLSEESIGRQCARKVYPQRECRTMHRL
jgi:hypothetical protein